MEVLSDQSLVGISDKAWSLKTKAYSPLELLSQLPLKVLVLFVLPDQLLVDLLQVPDAHVLVEPVIQGVDRSLRQRG